jgi:hypothetical protein
MLIQISLSEDYSEVLGQYEPLTGVIKELMTKHGIETDEYFLGTFYNSDKTVSDQHFELIIHEDSLCNFDRQDLFNFLNEVYKLLSSDAFISGYAVIDNDYYKVTMSYQDEDNYYPYVDKSDKESALKAVELPSFYD